MAAASSPTLRRALRTACLLTLLLAPSLRAQFTSRGPAPLALETGSAAWVVEMFYARPTFPQKAQYLTGEFAEHYANAPTMGSLLPRSVVVTSRPLLTEKSRAIYATSVRDVSHAQDWYTYLRRDGAVWKIEAVRTLSLPRVHYVLIDSMDARHSHGQLPDSLVPTLETMRLAIRSDSALARYVVDHQSALRSLAERFGAVRGVNGVSVDGDVSPAGILTQAEQRSFVAELRALRLGAMMRLSSQPRCVFLKIGGAGDNYVGFIYAPAGCVPPAMSPTEYIYVEPVAPGWFLYKTT